MQPVVCGWLSTSWPLTVVAITEDAPQVQSASRLFPSADAPPTARSAMAPSTEAERTTRRRRCTLYKRVLHPFGYGSPRFGVDQGVPAGHVRFEGPVPGTGTGLNQNGVRGVTAAAA